MGQVVNGRVRTLGGVAAAIAIVSTICAGCMSSPPPTLPEAARGSFPPRPAGIGQIDPCSLLDTEQARRLGVEQPGGSSVQTVDGTPAPTCTWLGITPLDQSENSLQVNFNAQLIQLPAEDAATPESRVVQIDGYGGLVRPDRGSRGEGPLCEVVVDAAPQRSIRVQALLRPYGPQLPSEELCRRATDAASMVMTTAVAITSH